MRRRDREISTEGPARYDDADAAEPTAGRRKDTDLSELSVRKSRRQIRKEEEAADRAPWDDPNDAGSAETKHAGTKHTGTGYAGAGHTGTGYGGADHAETEAARSGRDGAAGPGLGSDRGEEVAGQKTPRSNTLASVLSGNILSQSEVRRAYPYLIFVACLMFLYIANIFRTQYIYRQHSTLTEQVKELRAKSMTIASERMRATQQSNIMVELERRRIPLKESLAPNKVIPNPRRNGEEKNDR